MDNKTSFTEALKSVPANLRRSHLSSDMVMPWKA